jgi:hypothetical protein
LERAVQELDGEGYFDSLVDVTPIPCPCCGFLTLFAYRTTGTKQSLSFDICPVCSWVNDPMHSLDQECERGADSVRSERGAGELPAVWRIGQNVFGHSPTAQARRDT